MHRWPQKGGSLDYWYQPFGYHSVILDVDLSGPVALDMGAEGKGISLKRLGAVIIWWKYPCLSQISALTSLLLQAFVCMKYIASDQRVEIDLTRICCEADFAPNFSLLHCSTKGWSLTGSINPKGASMRHYEIVFLVHLIRRAGAE